MKFTEAQLEAAIIQLLGQQGFDPLRGESLGMAATGVIIEADCRRYLANHYSYANITDAEIDRVMRQLDSLPAGDLYHSNKTFCSWLSNGFLFKRDTRADGTKPKDLHLQLLDYANVADSLKDLWQPLVLAQITQDPRGIAEVSADYIVSQDNNIYKIVSQLAIEGGAASSAAGEKRIPDAILYINGLPLVVFEFKSAIRETATLHDAYVQLTTRYRRDIPQLFVYNALCVISDGVNNKMGSFFAPYEFFYAWRKVSGNELQAKEGINSLHTLVQGLFDKARLRDVLRHFIYFPDSSKLEEKIVCRYPQYYAATKLYHNIKLHRKRLDGRGGDGKGGTYFGATGCGKSFTMQFLVRLLMKSVDLQSPTIVLITDRTDLDDQLSQQFGKAKTYIGDQTVVTVNSRMHLRSLLKGRNSGGVFLTTIHKFNEDIEQLSARDNIICISDEAHRSQINLDQKITVVTEGADAGVKRSYGFAKYLHDSLPNATYVGFTGTPIDATFAVFGPEVDSYTMTESVQDEITVPIVYEGRAAKVFLNTAELEAIEAYYHQCEDAGSNEHQIEESKKATTRMTEILGNPERIEALAKDFVQHYEKRIAEGASICGKALFVSSSRDIAYQLYQQLKNLRPQWFVVRDAQDAAAMSEAQRQQAIDNGKLAKPSERVKMVMTRGQDDDKDQYDLLGDKAYRKTLVQAFKNAQSNFKIAIVVDMWLTGFDVPFLDSMYIDKPVQKHNLIQTISRVNRKFAGKGKGLVVDYIGIKAAMNRALKQYGKSDQDNVEDIAQAVIVVKDHLDLLAQQFYCFDSSGYFADNGSGNSCDPLARLNCLSEAAEYVLQTEQRHQRFMGFVKRLKAAYDICCGSESLTGAQCDTIHFYLAVRSIVFKRTKGDAPDSAQMNARVREMIAEVLNSDGVQEIFKLGADGEAGAIDIFNPDYLAKIEQIKLPNTKIQLLQQLLTKAINEFKKVNKVQGIDFSQRFKALVDKYNERKEEDTFNSELLKNLPEEMIALYQDLLGELNAGGKLGIDIEEKSFYDILKFLAAKYDFSYPEDKTLALAKAVKAAVDDKAKYTDWSQRDDIKAELKVDLILLLATHGYPPVDRDEVYKEIFEQAENFKKHRNP